MRSVYLIGFLYLAVCGYAWWRGPASTHASYTAAPTIVRPGSSAWEWFRAIKPYCNTLEVETAHRRAPPPETFEGAGFSAACYALAADIRHARSIIANLSGDDRWKAAGIVFDVGHPIADMGDDRSAGPIMELVVEFWPNHYQALYHAGASAFELGRYGAAKEYLYEFLRLYDTNDGFTRSARSMLDQMDGS